MAGVGHERHAWQYSYMRTLFLNRVENRVFLGSLIYTWKQQPHSLSPYCYTSFEVNGKNHTSISKYLEIVIRPKHVFLQIPVVKTLLFTLETAKPWSNYNSPFLKQGKSKLMNLILAILRKRMDMNPESILVDFHLSYVCSWVGVGLLSVALKRSLFS